MECDIFTNIPHYGTFGKRQQMASLRHKRVQKVCPCLLIEEGGRGCPAEPRRGRQPERFLSGLCNRTRRTLAGSGFFLPVCLAELLKIGERI